MNEWNEKGRNSIEPGLHGGREKKTNDEWEVLAARRRGKKRAVIYDKG